MLLLKFVLFLLGINLCKMVILKNIPRILSPELLSVLARMGHGDEIVLADANFPSSSISKAGPELVSLFRRVQLKLKFKRAVMIPFVSVIHLKIT